MLYSPLVLKAHATAPIVRAQLSADGATPYSIPAGAVVELFVMNDKMTAPYAESFTMTIEAALTGIVTTDRAGEWNTLPGNYLVEIHVVGPGSALRIFPDKGTAQLTVLPSLQ